MDAAHLIRLAVSLAVIAAMLYALRRLGGVRLGISLPRGDRDGIELLATRALAHGNTVHLVRIGGRTFALASGGGGVGILAEIDDRSPIAEGAGVQRTQVVAADRARCVREEALL